MNLDLIMTSGIALAAICTAIVQGIKMVLPERMFKWCPLIAIAVGIILSYLTSASTDGLNFKTYLMSGLYTGLISSGLYSGIKTTMRNNEEVID